MLAARYPIAIALLMASARLLPVGAAEAPKQWKGLLLRPVSREQIYEFTKRPALKKVGKDRYEISFASKAKCDVVVAIEDDKGKIIRHIVYGVLGANAPAPLKKDSLEQTLVWNGKDDFGKYTKNREKLRLRVSLGLKPTFDKVMGWHPKDTNQSRRILAIAADKDGVFTFHGSSWNQIRKYDHDGNYVSTVVPWDPAKLAQVRVAKRTIPDGKIWKNEPPAGSRIGPLSTGFGAAAVVGTVSDYGAMAAGAGRIVLTNGGYGKRRLFRLRTDGTTGGETINGALLHNRFGVKSSTPRLAVSPDGKWIYFAGLDPRGRTLPNRGRIYWNAVFRVPWDRTNNKAVFSHDPHVGDPPFAGTIGGGSDGSGIGKDNDQFYQIEGLACDAQGRLYVSDNRNNRIQVFSPKGKHLKTIPVATPQDIVVHQKTGEIYLLSYKPHPHDWTDKFGFELSGGEYTLLKLGPLKDPKVLINQKIKTPGSKYHPHWFRPVLALDSWTARPRVWLTAGAGLIRIIEERDGRFELFDDFVKNVKKAGHTPHMMPGYNMPYTFADPVRGHVYLGGAHCGPLRRIDPEEGKKWQVIKLNLPSYGKLDEAIFGRNGLLYLRTLKYIARFDPDKMGTTVDRHAEIPFDYGEAIRSGARGLRGVIRISWAQGGANGFNNGLAVSPKGALYCMVDNYQSFNDFKVDPNRYWDGNQARALKQRLRDGFRPNKYPGRPRSGSLVWRWNTKGELTGSDLVKGMLINSYGIRADRDENIYVGLGYHQMVAGADGKRKPHIGGAVVKFPPSGGRFSATGGAPIRLSHPPKREPELCGYSTKHKVWVDNACWSYPGLDMVYFVDPISPTYPCHCANSRFDTDVYGRSFIPKAYAYTVAIIDTNGNRICEIGRYGNCDNPAMKKGDTDIGIAECSYVATVSDKWLYLTDDGNLRIIRVKLGYHTEELVPVGRAATGDE